MKHQFKDQKPVTAPKEEVKAVEAPQEVQQEPVPNTKIFATVVNTDKVNVRSSAEIGNNVVKILSKGDRVEVVNKGDAWSQTTIGYIMTQYLKF